MRYTGHLDLHRTWERTFRRARLPLAYTQGFNPHPRLNLAAALPLGFTSDAEMIDVWFDRELSLPEIEAALTPALPPGIRVNAIEAVDQKAPTLQTQVEAAEYLVTLLEQAPGLDQRIQDLLDAGSLPRRRRDKDYDLRPLVFSLQALPPGADGLPRLRCVLSARESATGRPEEVLDALGVPFNSARSHRTRLFLRAPLDPAAAGDNAAGDSAAGDAAGVQTEEPPQDNETD